MHYDFESSINRSQTGSFKWEQMKRWNPQVEPDVVPLSVADMELKNPPEIINGLRAYLEGTILGYTGPTPAYGQAVAGWMRRRHQWEIEPEWLVQTGGVVSAFFNAVKVFTQPGDGVMFFTPAYYPFYAACARQKRIQVKIPLLLEGERYGIDWASFEEKAREPRNRMLLFCSPHNPVGRVWTEGELTRLVDICRRNDVLIVSDEIHFDLVMPGFRHRVLASVSPQAAEHSIILTAPSKTFNLAGIQCSNTVISNKELRERFIGGLEQAGIHLLNALAYKACEIAYNKCESWLDELIGHIRGNQLLVMEYMHEHLPMVTIFPMEGTYLLWMDFRALGFAAETLEEKMHREAQVFMDEGYIFGPEGAGFERMNLAAPRAAILDACRRMGRVFGGR